MGSLGKLVVILLPTWIVYYLKFLLREKSCRIYRFLLLKHQPIIVIVDMVHTAADHANTRKEGNRKYGKADKEGRLFFPYEVGLTSSDDSESIRLSKESVFHGSHPRTNH